MVRQLEVRVDRGRDLVEEGDGVGEATGSRGRLDGQRVHLVDVLTGDAQPRPAGHQHPQVGGPLQHVPHEVGGLDHVLEVVEDQQQAWRWSASSSICTTFELSPDRMPSSLTASSATSPASATFVRST